MLYQGAGSDDQVQIRNAWLENLRESAGFRWINEPQSAQALREQNRDDL